MTDKNKRVLSFLLTIILFLGNIWPTYAETLDGAMAESAEKETTQNNMIDAGEYQLDIEGNVLKGFILGKEPIEPIDLVIPSEVKKIEKRAFYNSKMIKSIDFSNTVDLNIDDHAFQNASLKGDLNLNGVASIGKYAFSDNMITDIKTDNLESIGDYAFRQNNISNLDLNVNKIGDNAFEENNIKEATITSESTPELGQAIFKSNPLTKITLNTPDFDISKELFTGVNEKVIVNFNNTNQTSKDTSSYLVNPIDITINYIKNEDKSNIGSDTELVERDAKPYEIDEPILAGYKLLPSDDYTLKDGKILFNKTPLDLLFEVNEDPEIRFSSNKQSLYFAGAEISTKDILSDVYIKKVNGQVVPAIDDNGNVLEELSFDPMSIGANESSKGVKFTYTEAGKTVEEIFTFSRSSEDILKQEIGNGWRYEDFQYYQEELVGFSELGLEKLNNGNRELILPGINPLNGKTIKSIEKYAFEKKDINYVDFSKLNDLELIGENSFNGNNIKTVNFSNNPYLKTIESSAFRRVVK